MEAWNITSHVKQIFNVPNLDTVRSGNLKLNSLLARTPSPVWSDPRPCSGGGAVTAVRRQREERETAAAAETESVELKATAAAVAAAA